MSREVTRMEETYDEQGNLTSRVTVTTVPTKSELLSEYIAEQRRAKPIWPAQPGLNIDASVITGSYHGTHGDDKE